MMWCDVNIYSSKKLVSKLIAQQFRQSYYVSVENTRFSGNMADRAEAHETPPTTHKKCWVNTYFLFLFLKYVASLKEKK